MADLENSIDILLCAAILKSPEKAEKLFFSRVGKHSLVDKGREAFEFIEKHYRSYGKMPDLETVFNETGVNLPDGTKEPVEYYIDKVKDRKIGSILKSSINKMVKGIEVGKHRDMLDAMRKTVGEVNEKFPEDSEGVKSIGERVDERKKQYEKIRDMEGFIDGIETPWTSISNATQGWHKGELITIVARLGVGKSWAAVLVAKKAWELGEKVLFVSMEMPVFQIERRFDAVVVKLPYKDLKRGMLGDDLQAKYYDYLENLKNVDNKIRNLHVVSGSNVSSVSDVELIMERVKPTIVIIDGVYLIKLPGFKGPMWERVSEVITEAKRLAEKKQIPVIVTSQFNRQVGSKSPSSKSRPENISFSDAIGQSSDTVLAMSQTETDLQNAKMTFKLIKLREDEPVEILTEWNFNEMNFEEITDLDETPIDSWEDGDKSGEKPTDDEVQF